MDPASCRRRYRVEPQTQAAMEAAGARAPLSGLAQGGSAPVCLPYSYAT